METTEKNTKEIRSLTNQELVQKIDLLAKEERRITIEVLRLLREIERRQLFAELGFPSLFAYCTKELRYSEAAACRRIEAMRAMRETPEIEFKMESGELSLSAVTQARTTLRQFEKFAKTQVTSETRKAVMLSLCGQSKREVEKVLALNFSTSVPTTPIVRQETANGMTRVTFEFAGDEMKVFEEINRLSGRPQNLKETVLRLATKELTHLRKVRGELSVRKKRSDQNVSRSSGHDDSQEVGQSSPLLASEPSPAEVKNEATLQVKTVCSEIRRPIPVVVKRSVWHRAGGRCEYRTQSGQRCEGRHSLEFDHIAPVSLGGLSNADNLRVYCRQHNILSATQILGPKLMGKFIPALR